MARGYTLLELLVVLAIIGLIAALAAPAAGTAIAKATLDGDARTLASYLRDEQRAAAVAQKTVTVTAADAAAADGKIGARAELSVAGGAIRYFPDGTTTGGSLSIGESGRVMRLDVAWLTGEVTVESEP